MEPVEMTKRDCAWRQFEQLAAAERRRDPHLSEAEAVARVAKTAQGVALYALYTAPDAGLTAAELAEAAAVGLAAVRKAAARVARGQPADFAEAVARVEKRDGVPYSVAATRAASEFCELFAEWRSR